MDKSDKHTVYLGEGLYARLDGPEHVTIVTQDGGEVAITPDALRVLIAFCNTHWCANDP